MKPSFFTKYKQIQDLSLSVSFHDLRHSCASFLLAEGVDLATIQEILGHAQISTTRIYLHIVNETKNNALQQMGIQLIGDFDMEEEE